MRSIEGEKEVISYTSRTISKQRHLWHIAHIHITRRSSNFRNKRVRTVLKRPSRPSAGQGKRNDVSSRVGVGLDLIPHQIHFRRSITPIDRVRIRKILVHPHRLIRTRRHDRQLNRTRIETTR